ncbi:MAG: tRNA guanosine(34) transglycosylase Tgt [Anaerolineae bacterium]|nr:tRNA guanosine(34) transglycosylase Tgt [Anaerolineae bacterium]
MAGRARLITAHGTVSLPTFFPDATRAVVRTVDAQDLQRCGIEGLVVNTFHLTHSPGIGLVKSQGGVHRFMGWERPIISDSGGFQAMSMIRENARYGTISDAGIHFTNVDAKGRKKLRLTPEKCIQIQFDLGADLMICLDDCPRPDADEGEVADSVRRTIHWAGQCKEEFERQLASRRLDGEKRPLLFGVIHGGYSKRARWHCAEALISIGFDGYGFGGWPLDLEGNLAAEILAYTADLMPDDRPKYALGVGSPEGVVRCHEMGYGIFDCVLPTRDARHQRLYCYDGEGGDPFAYSYLYIQDNKHKRDPRPVSDACDCPCCAHYSRSYLHHLFEIQDGLAPRLATIHNLRFYAQLMEKLRDPAQSARASGTDADRMLREL